MKQRLMILGLACLLSACPTDTKPSPTPPPATPPPPPSVTQLNVSPTTGSDVNLGTSSAPLKTLRKALALAQTGQTVKLLHGTYDVTNGEAFPETVPDGVSLLADNPRDILLVGKASQDGLVFAGNGSAIGLDLQGFATAIAATTGTQSLDNLAFSGNTTGLSLSASAKATLSGSSSLKGGEIAARLTDNATLTMTGGVISGMKGSSSFSDVSKLVGGFYGAGSSSLNLSDVTVKDNPVSWAVYVWENASATIKTSHFTGNGFVNGSGATIEATGSAKLSLEATSLFLNNDDGVDISQNGSATIKGGEISAGMTYGMNIFGANATVSIDGTKIDGNQEIGLRFDLGTLEIANAEIRGNKLYGLYFGNQGGPGNLKMRNTQVLDNGAAGVSISLNDVASQADLGSPSELGKNTLRGNGTNLGVSGKSTVNASGNTWEPNQQGADADGHYAAGTAIAGPTTGSPKNIAVSAGSQVQL